MVESVSGPDEHYNSRGIRTRRRYAYTKGTDDVFGPQSGFLTPVFNVPSMIVTGVFIGGSSTTCQPIYTIMPSNYKIPRIF